MLYESKSDMINVGCYCYPVQSLGPGDRFVLWTQGCNRRCYRCASPELQPTTGGCFYSVKELVGIMQDSKCSGLTISGGEPLLQAFQIECLLQEVRSKLPIWDIILFTGFLFDQIEQGLRSRLVNLVDLLIDGPYEDVLNDGFGLRGSSNQKLHFFTPRFLPISKDLINSPRPKRQLFLLSDEKMMAVGIASHLTVVSEKS